MMEKIIHPRPRRGAGEAGAMGGGRNGGGEGGGGAEYAGGGFGGVVDALSSIEG
jgi:hypothetical protein